MAARVLRVVGIASLAVVCMIVGCGKESKKNNAPTAPTGTAVPFSDGIWIEHTEITVTSGDPGCTEFVDSSDDTFQVTQGRVADDSTLVDCTISGTGGNFTLACASSIPVSGTCVVHTQWDGTGTYDANNFTAAGNITISTAGDCSAYAIPSCVLHAVSTGHKQPLAAANANVTRDLSSLLSETTRRYVGRVVYRHRP